MNIVFYITGHGYGHASRSCQIISALAVLLPESVFYIRTSVPYDFFKSRLTGNINFDYRNKVVDIGTVQHNALKLDKKATLEAAAAFWLKKDDFIHDEIKELPSDTQLVLSDIAPLAFLVADKLGSRAVALSNFLWSWIYKSYAARYPEFAWLVRDIENAYSKAVLALRYPFYGDFSCCKQVMDIPLVAQETNKDPDKVRDMLKVKSSQKLITAAFGGFRFPDSRLSVSKLHSEFSLLVLSSSTPIIPESPELTVPDIIAASDAIITKPGYGMISECVAAQKPVLYTSRGDFAEYGKLVTGMKKYIPSLFIPQKDLLDGKIVPYLEKLFEKKYPKAKAKKNGDLVAAQLISKLIKK